MSEPRLRLDVGPRTASDRVVNRLLARVDAEVAAGRAWRAREILRSALPEVGPHARALERYGQLLLSLGEVFEAGKYLFVSGSRRPEYQSAIDVFVGRHRRSPRDLLTGLPARLRPASLEECPAALRADLEALGVTKGDVSRVASRPRAEARATPSRGWREVLAQGIACVLLLALVIGLLQIAQWIVTHAR